MSGGSSTRGRTGGAVRDQSGVGAIREIRGSESELKIAIARAQIDARNGNQNEAVNSLEWIEKEARKAGLLGREFEV